MGILTVGKRKLRPLAIVGLAGVIGLTGLGLAPTAMANGSDVQVVNAGKVSKDYWDVITYQNTPFGTSQECVSYAQSKLKPRTWAQCVYAEYQGQNGWFAVFLGTNQ